MDIIDTTLRVGSREKLHPKHGYDEEVCSVPQMIKKTKAKHFIFTKPFDFD